jgi:hypothetical protein
VKRGTGRWPVPFFWLRWNKRLNDEFMRGASCSLIKRHG